jgi:hypothetical protein
MTNRSQQVAWLYVDSVWMDDGWLVILEAGLQFEKECHEFAA